MRGSACALLALVAATLAGGALSCRALDESRQAHTAPAPYSPRATQESSGERSSGQQERTRTPDPASVRVGDHIDGGASVVDGDGLVVAGIRIRLFGIDAPEVLQTCRREDGSVWRCGQHATVALDDLAGGRRVSCLVHALDAYGRAVAVCRRGAVDLGAEIVRHGWAFAYRRFSRDYVSDEQVARDAHVGIWSGTCEPPWQWRERQRRSRTR